MRAYEIETNQRAAYNRGVEAAKAAASWVIDGNTSQEHIAALVHMMDVGDPMLEQHLPVRPNLSGQEQDDPTPMTLGLEILGPGVDTPSRQLQVAGLVDAFERGVEDTFEPEVERIVRGAMTC